MLSLQVLPILSPEGGGGDFLFVQAGDTFKAHCHVTSG